MLIEEALDHVLWNDPPIANYATHFPVQDMDLGGTVVEANSPVVISFAGANTDPALKEARQARSAGAHLAWGAGPHACPAKSPAQVIAVAAVEAILNALPDLQLAVPADQLQWRPGLFHRALVALPVRFGPTPATRVASALGNGAMPAARPTPAEQPLRAQAPSAPRPAEPQRAGRKGGFWSTFLDLFRV